MNRMQLVNMCRYMGISPYGSAAFLRFQLRYKVRGEYASEAWQKMRWRVLDRPCSIALHEKMRLAESATVSNFERLKPPSNFPHSTRAALKEDDQRILWEGLDSLTKSELRECCQERGMRSTGLSKEGYRKR